MVARAASVASARRARDDGDDDRARGVGEPAVVAADGVRRGVARLPRRGRARCGGARWWLWWWPDAAVRARCVGARVDVDARRRAREGWEVCIRSSVVVVVVVVVVGFVA